MLDYFCLLCVFRPALQDLVFEYLENRPSSCVKRCLHLHKFLQRLGCMLPLRLRMKVNEATLFLLVFCLLPRPEVLNAGTTSGPNTSKNPLHTNSISILNETQRETNFSLMVSNEAPTTTSCKSKLTPK